MARYTALTSWCEILKIEPDAAGRNSFKVVCKVRGKAAAEQAITDFFRADGNRYYWRYLARRAHSSGPSQQMAMLRRGLFRTAQAVDRIADEADVG